MRFCSPLVVLRISHQPYLPPAIPPSIRIRRYAFIQFSEHAEAVAALDHPEPVFAQPAIKLNWAHHNFQEKKGKGKGHDTKVGGRQGVQSPWVGSASQASDFLQSGAGAHARGRGRGRQAAASGRALGLAGCGGAVGGRVGCGNKLTPPQVQPQREGLIKAQIDQQKALIAKISTNNVSKEERAAVMAQVHLQCHSSSAPRPLPSAPACPQSPCPNHASWGALAWHVPCSTAQCAASFTSCQPRPSS